MTTKKKTAPVMGKIAAMIARRDLLASKGRLSPKEKAELLDIGDLPPEITGEAVPTQRSIAAYEAIIADIGDRGYDVHQDKNYADTATRAAKALAELVWPRDKILDDISQMMEKVFPGRYSGMIAQPNIFVPCICPHHLLPVIMKVTVGYVPKKNYIGISKLSRIARTYGHQPIMQEEYTDQLSSILFEGLNAKGVGVYVRGYHTCQSIRGARTHDVTTVTASLQGIFYQPQTRQEFYSLAAAGRESLL